MPLKEQDHNLIEKHLSGQLNEGERIAFDQRLGDSDFKKELDLQNDLKIAFKAEGREHLKKQLIGFEKKIHTTAEKENPSSSRFSIGRILMIAASVVFLLFAGYWFSNRGPSNDQLFAQYFVPYPNVIAPIDKSAAKVDRQGEAYQTYELKNYQEALRLFDRLNTKDDAVKFYQGICYLVLNQPQQAIDHFETIRNQNSGPYSTPMYWYKALALLKLNKVEDAKLFLETVAKNGETKKLRSQAVELLEVLGD